MVDEYFIVYIGDIWINVDFFVEILGLVYRFNFGFSCIEFWFIFLYGFGVYCDDVI